MAWVNKVFLVGNLGADPETFSGDKGDIVNFNIATTEKWIDKETGDAQEKTEWHRIVAFGRTAESCAKYLRKGRQVHIEGKLQTRQWNDKEGAKRYTTEVVALNVQFLGSPAQEAERTTPTAAPVESAAAASDDDLPF